VAAAVDWARDRKASTVTLRVAVDNIVAIWRALGEPGNLADWFSEPEELPAV